MISSARSSYLEFAYSACTYNAVVWLWNYYARVYGIYVAQYNSLVYSSPLSLLRLLFPIPPYVHPFAAALPLLYALPLFPETDFFWILGYAIFWIPLSYVFFPFFLLFLDFRWENSFCCAVYKCIQWDVSMVWFCAYTTWGKIFLNALIRACTTRLCVATRLLRFFFISSSLNSVYSSFYSIFRAYIYLYKASLP